MGPTFQVTASLALIVFVFSSIFGSLFVSVSVDDERLYVLQTPSRSMSISFDWEQWESTASGSVGRLSLGQTLPYFHVLPPLDWET